MLHFLLESKINGKKIGRIVSKTQEKINVKQMAIITRQRKDTASC